MAVFEGRRRISVLVSRNNCAVCSTGWLHISIHVRDMVIFRSRLAKGRDRGIWIICSIGRKCSFVDIIIQGMSGCF